jgi:anaerobic selenocysteine-containing dehydrogenase
MKVFDRYSLLKDELSKVTPPFVKIPMFATDRVERWMGSRTMMDALSEKYYHSSEYGFLILLANPQYLNELDIEEGDMVRVPFPLELALEAYITEVTKALNI